MRRSVATTTAAALAAFLVFLALLPVSGNDSDPPECFSLLGYVVPCGLGPEQAQGVGFAVAGAVIACALVVLGAVVGRTGLARGDDRPG